MIRKTLLGLFGLGLIALATSPVNASTTAVQNFSVAYTSSGAGQSLGFDFTAKSAITVTNLGFYDAGNTTTTGQAVFLYDVTTSTLLATQTVSGAINSGNFNYANSAIAINLNTTDVYSVYSVFTGINYGNGSIAVSTDLANVLPNRATNGTNGLYGPAGSPPTASYGIVATDFIYIPTSVPEPASIAMMGLGLAGAAFAARRKMVKISA